MTLGNIDALKLDKARTRAQTLAGQVASGIDPMEAKKKEALQASKAAQADRTIGDLLDLFLKMRASEIREKTFDDYERWIRRNIKPEIGTLNANDITQARLQKLIDDIQKSHPTTARRVGELLSSALGWALKTTLNVNGDDISLRPKELGNPAASLKLPPRHFIDNALEEHQVRILRDAITWAEETLPGDVVKEAIAVTRVALLTGARQGEIRLLKPDQVHLNRGVILLERHAHKTGDQQKRPAVYKSIALVDEALEIVDQFMKIDDDRTYVFRGKKPHLPVSKITFITFGLRSKKRRVSMMTLTCPNFVFTIYATPLHLLASVTV